MSQRLRQHAVRLCDGALVLCPMTEDDWGVLQKRNSDPDVLYHAEGDDVTSRPLAETQMIYRGVSRYAFCLMAELDGRPIGEC